MANKRVCAGCQLHLDRSCYTDSEWEVSRNISRCCICIDNGEPVVSDGGVDERQRQPSRRDGRIAARCNESSRASFTPDELSFPFAEGAFRWAARGTYTDGARRGQHCVCKWFKDGHTDNDEFYDLDIKAMYKALDLVELWNKDQYIDQVIMVNIPEVWVFGKGDEWAGLKALQEPYIEGYQKFNSNTGWKLNDERSSAWSEVMQALSHFTYHVTAGKFLLCDLQGGIYNNSVILTDPVILSRDKVYGKTDLGPLGISSFFSNHRCSHYCQAHWMKPVDQSRYHALSMGTSMAGGVGAIIAAPPARGISRMGYNNSNSNNNNNKGQMLPPPRAARTNTNGNTGPPLPPAFPYHHHHHHPHASMRHANAAAGVGGGGFLPQQRSVPPINGRNSHYGQWLNNAA